MIDTHCHIQSSDYDTDRAEVLAHAAAEGVEAIVVPAINEASFDSTLAMTAFRAPYVSCAIGVHPHHASEVTPATYERVRSLMSNADVVAVGEIGLDYHYDFSPREIQQDVFRTQVQIARDHGKPVIVHNRDSDDDLLRILGEEQTGELNGVLHCFSSSVEMLQRALELRLHVSFTGNITFKNSSLAPVVAAAPIDRIMLETDSPWMSPPPFRGKRNLPERVRAVAEKIAEIKTMSVNDVISATTRNARRFFQLTAAVILMAIATAGRAQTDAPPPVPPPEPPPAVMKTDTMRIRGDSGNTVYVMPRFYRFIGLGVSGGTSTLSPEAIGTTEANLFTYNIAATVMATRALGLDLRYWHFVDNLYGYQKRPDSTDLNDYYSNIDINLRVLFNPKNRISFGGLIGVSFMNFRHPDTKETISFPAFFGALSIGVNLPFSWGMLQPQAQYRVVREYGSATSSFRGTDLVAVLEFGVMYYFPEDFKF